ncbi:MAG: hypothetical protein EOP54_32245 [Sphingobacteriales bacterium]|nr:MAG: hypothetical protein EOP54_32245 [Sphingobacteriales bacterium]
MKRLRYLIPVLLGAALSAGCLKGNDNQANPNPEGIFSGEFRLISRKGSPNANTVDTVKANIRLTLNQSNASYSITGDTATIHAGSKGIYGVNGGGIGFADATLSSSNANKNAPVIGGKAHLNGSYYFVYNGLVLQMKTVVGDSVAFEYDLKKTN